MLNYVFALVVILNGFVVPRESADYDDIGGQLEAGPLGLVSTMFLWCRRWLLCSAGGVQGKGTKQFLAVMHRAPRRIPLCCPIFQTFPARHRIACWAKGVRMEALQSSSFIKRDPIICCCGWAGGIHCMIVVTNRAQRCETHKLALLLVGGRVKVSRAVSVVAILVKSNTAREF